MRGEPPDAQLCADIAAANESTGFFALTGHGVDMNLVRTCLSAGAAFFDLDQEEKAKYVVQNMTMGRGYEISPEHQDYMALFTKVVMMSSEQERAGLGHPEGSTRHGILSERFMCGPPSICGTDLSISSSSSSSSQSRRREPEYYDSDLGKAFFGPNVWPCGSSAVVAPGSASRAVIPLRSNMEALYEELDRVARVILRVFAVTLGEAEDFFDRVVDGHHSNMQVANYPSQLCARPGLDYNNDELARQRDLVLRKKAHVDSGTITLLMADDWMPGSSTWRRELGGLQLETREGVWVDVVDVPPGAILVNLGTLMSVYTNGRWKSTLHRVVHPQPAVAEDSRRLSIAYFHKTDYDASITPVSSCIRQGKPPMFEALKASDLTRQGIMRRLLVEGLSASEASNRYHEVLQRIREAQQE